MRGVVAFDYQNWLDIFPELSNVSERQASFYFEQAEGCVNNSPYSLVHDIKARKNILYLLTAHIATMAQQAAGGGSMVGRIASASQGSVSVSTAPIDAGRGEQWYTQTSYGNNALQLLRPYIQMRMIPGRNLAGRWFL